MLASSSRKARWVWVSFLGVLLAFGKRETGEIVNYISVPDRAVARTADSDVTRPVWDPSFPTLHELSLFIFSVAYVRSFSETKGQPKTKSAGGPFGRARPGGVSPRAGATQNRFGSGISRGLFSVRKGTNCGLGCRGGTVAGTWAALPAHGRREVLCSVLF